MRPCLSESAFGERPGKGERTNARPRTDETLSDLVDQFLLFLATPSEATVDRQDVAHSDARSLVSPAHRGSRLAPAVDRCARLWPTTDRRLDRCHLDPGGADPISRTQGGNAEDGAGQAGVRDRSEPPRKLVAAPRFSTQGEASRAMSRSLPALEADAESEWQRKRIGRGIGSGKGGRATRGQKGQKARAGNGKPKAHFEGGQTPLTMRYPKRGFTNP